MLQDHLLNLSDALNLVKNKLADQDLPFVRSPLELMYFLDGPAKAIHLEDIGAEGYRQYELTRTVYSLARELILDWLYKEKLKAKWADGRHARSVAPTQFPNSSAEFWNGALVVQRDHVEKLVKLEKANKARIKALAEGRVSSEEIRIILQPEVARQDSLTYQEAAQILGDHGVLVPHKGEKGSFGRRGTRSQVCEVLKSLQGQPKSGPRRPR